MPIVTIRGMPFLHLADRAPLKAVAVEVAHHLRVGDEGKAADALARIPELGAMGVTDAILGSRQVSHVPWTPAPAVDPSARVGWVSDLRFPEGLHDELRTRGVRPMSLNTAQLWLRTQRGAPLPDALASWLTFDRSADYLRTNFLDRGVTVVNPPAWNTANSKTVLAETWKVHGIGTPETVTRLHDAHSVAAAYARLGPDVVIKASLGYRGAQVHGAHSLAEALAIAAKTKQPIMQRMVDVGSSDVRLHFSRDWKTGLLHPVGAVERVSLGTDFRTNLSMGGAARPIYDFSGSDPALPRDMVDEARRAGDAAGLDWFSADVARDQATGKPLLFEVDTKPTALEIHFPVPRAHQTYGHLADLLLHGDNATLEAARGATLRPGLAR